MKEKTGRYPVEIKIDCVGAFIDPKNKQQIMPLQNHLNLFINLNKIANAYKHSFVNSDLNITGENEPAVFALSLKRNRLSEGIKLHGISLRDLVLSFNAFYKEAMAWLRDYSEKHRNSG